MISGRVTDTLRVVINVQILAGDGNWNALNVVIDTGFNGQLALPQDIVHKLELTLGQTRRVTPAIGQTRTVSSGHVQLNWNGVPGYVRVVLAGTEPLLGMALLWNNRIAIDAVADGAVTVTPLGG